MGLLDPLTNTLYEYIDVWPGMPCSLTWLIAGLNTLGGGSFRGHHKLVIESKHKLLPGRGDL